MSTNSTYRKTIHASTEYLAEVRNFVANHAASHGFNTQKISDIRLAVDEAITNIIKHAYKGDDSHTIDIKVSFRDDKICIQILDTGATFNLKTFPQPDIKEKIKQKKRGGMGVYLIHSLMDDVSYGRKSGSNEMTMCKYKH